MLDIKYYESSLSEFVDLSLKGFTEKVDRLLYFDKWLDQIEGGLRPPKELCVKPDIKLLWVLFITMKEYNLGVYSKHYLEKDLLRGMFLKSVYLVIEDLYTLSKRGRNA